MAVNLATVTGNLETLIGGTPSIGRLWFRLTMPDWNDAGNIFAPQYVEAVADPTTGAFSVALQSTDDFEVGATYRAILKYFDIDGLNKEYELGAFAVGTGGPFELTDLLAVPVVEPVPADILALARAALAAAEAAADAAAEDSDAAALSADQAAAAVAAVATFVDSFGAIGDGVEVDSVAIAAAIAAAGPWGRVVFRPGAVYIYDTQFTLLTGQQIDLNGATLKRAPQAKTTLAANFSAVGNPANQTITVVDTSSFRVGSYITLCKPTSQGDDTENRFRTDRYGHRIISKTPTTLTVQGGFEYAYLTGDEVVTAFIGFFSTAPFVQIYGGTINGGTTKHDAAASGSTANGYQVRGRRWEIMSEFRLSGDYTHIHHLHFKDIPCEGFLLGGNNSKFSEITGENIGGNLSHISGGDGTLGRDCRVDGANRVWIEHDARAAGGDPTRYGTIGHENGAYAWSLDCPSASLSFCTAVNAKSLFAPPYSPGNDRATITACVGIDCQMPFYTSTYNTRGMGVTVELCQFFNCGTGFINRGLSNPPEANADVHFAILDCRFYETKMSITGAHKLEWRGGFMRFNDPQTSGLAILLSSVTNCKIDTKIDGAQYGIYMSGLCRNVTITPHTHRLGNYMLNAAALVAGSRGIAVRGGSVVYDAVVKRDDMADWNTPTSVTAIYACDSLLVEGVAVHMTVGSAFVDNNSKSGVRVRGNTIETNTTGTVRPVIIRAGADNFVTDNEITVAVRDDTSGAGVTLRDNDLIGWAA